MASPSHRPYLVDSIQCGHDGIRCARYELGRPSTWPKASPSGGPMCQVRARASQDLAPKEVGDVASGASGESSTEGYRRFTSATTERQPDPSDGATEAQEPASPGRLCRRGSEGSLPAQLSFGPVGDAAPACCLEEAGWSAGGVGSPAQPKGTCLGGLSRYCGWPAEGAAGRAHPKGGNRPKEACPGPTEGGAVENWPTGQLRPGLCQVRPGRLGPGSAESQVRPG